MKIQLRKLDNNEMRTLVQQEVVVQTMEQAKVEFNDGTNLKGIQLINQARMLKQNIRLIDPATPEYVVAKAKHKEVTTYVNNLRAVTIRNEDWNKDVIASRADLDALIEDTINYDVEKENEEIMLRIKEEEEGRR